MRALLKDPGACLTPSRSGEQPQAALAARICRPVYVMLLCLQRQMSNKLLRIPTPPPLCLAAPLLHASSAGWLSCSAAASRKQVPGHVLLAHVAAVHDIAACSHALRQSCCCASCWRDAGDSVAVRSQAAAGWSGLPLQQAAPERSRRAWIPGRGSCSGCAHTAGTAAVAGRGGSDGCAARQHQLLGPEGIPVAAVNTGMPRCSSSSSCRHQPGMHHLLDLQHPGAIAAAPAGLMAAGACHTALGLPVNGAHAIRQAGPSIRAMPSWHAAAGYSARRGWGSAAAGTAAALSDSWRTKVPSSMTYEEKQEVCSLTAAAAAYRAAAGIW